MSDVAVVDGSAVYPFSYVLSLKVRRFQTRANVGCLTDASFFLERVSGIGSTGSLKGGRIGFSFDNRGMSVAIEDIVDGFPLLPPMRSPRVGVSIGYARSKWFRTRYVDVLLSGYKKVSMVDDVQQALAGLQSRITQLEDHPAGCTCTKCTG